MIAARPACNTNFYSASADTVREWVAGLTDESRPSPLSTALVAGLVPHAGWSYCGAVAGRVWRMLRDNSHPDTIILFGTVHYPGVAANAAYPGGEWETPLGPVEVDAELARMLAEQLGGLMVLEAAAHDQEHSIEVHLPFIKALFPEAKIVPIAVPPSPGAVPLGERTGALTLDLSVLAVGSTDLTHYGDRYMFVPRGKGPDAHEWMRNNDRRVLDLGRVQAHRVRSATSSPPCFRDGARFPHF